MNKEAALSRLTALESEAAELRRIIEAPEKLPGLWRPEENASYWSLTDAGRAHSSSAGYLGETQKKIAFGNCFSSEEMATKAAPLVAQCNKMISAWLQHLPNAEPKNFNISIHPSFATVQDRAEVGRILNAEQVK